MDNTYEREIDLRDLVFHILHKWRSILLCILVFAVLAGGYKIGKGIMQQRDSEYIANLQKQYDIQKQEYELVKAGYERDINKFTTKIAYEENSILLKINPYKKLVATADVFVEMEEETNAIISMVDPADSVLIAYSSAISKGSYLDELSKKTKIDSQYLKELISVNLDSNGNMFSVSVMFEDKDGAQEILDRILDNLNAIYPEVADNLGKHKIIVMNKNVFTTADQEFAEYQAERADNLAAMHTNLDETQKALDNLNEPQNPSNLSMKSVLKSGIKYSVIGALLGGLLLVFFYVAVYIMSSRLYSTEELKSRFNIKILGVFIQKRKKRVFSVIDSYLDKLDGKEYVSEASVYERIAANVANYTVKGQTILLTGTAEEETLKCFKDKLKEMLPEVIFEAGMDMNKYPATLTMLSKVDGIILIEKCGVSKYNDIQKVLETVYSLHQKVVGCIVL